MNEADRELLKQVLDELNGTVDTSVEDLAILCDRLKARLEKPVPEPVGEIKLLGIDGRGVRLGEPFCGVGVEWAGGGMPGEGTKLYAGGD